MAGKELVIKYQEFGSLSDCPAKITELYLMAEEAAKKAYAPYSGFQVGAALELEDNSRYSASNQENKAYPSGLCAERSALFFVNGQKPDVAVRIMVLAAFDTGQLTEFPAYPCGACRQVMIESQERGGSNMEVWMVGAKLIQKVDSVEALLPFKFSF